MKDVMVPDGQTDTFCRSTSTLSESHFAYALRCVIKFIKLKEASTHKSATTHAGNVLVPLDLDL